MTWNYRIFRHKNKYANKVTYWYALHEVFYNDEGKPFTYATEPDAVGDSIDDLVAGITLMLKDAKDCKKGVRKGKRVKILEEDDFEEGGCYYSFMVAEEKEWRSESENAIPFSLAIDSIYNIPSNSKCRTTLQEQKDSESGVRNK